MRPVRSNRDRQSSRRRGSLEELSLARALPSRLTTIVGGLGLVEASAKGWLSGVEVILGGLALSIGAASALRWVVRETDLAFRASRGDLRVWLRGLRGSAALTTTALAGCSEAGGAS